MIYKDMHTSKIFRLWVRPYIETWWATSSRQPGCLERKTRGFPSPSHNGFGFIIDSLLCKISAKESFWDDIVHNTLHLMTLWGVMTMHDVAIHNNIIALKRDFVKILDIHFPDFLRDDWLVGIPGIIGCVEKFYTPSWYCFELMLCHVFSSGTRIENVTVHRDVHARRQ